MPALVFVVEVHTPAYVHIHQHTSAYVRIRPHTSAYVSIRREVSLAPVLVFVEMRLQRRLRVSAYLRTHFRVKDTPQSHLKDTPQKKAIG